MKRVRILAGVSKTQQQLANAVAKSLATDFTLVNDSAELNIVVGGDGTLLHYLRELGYPATPFLGIDAGSLGFFQEIDRNSLATLARSLKSGKYSLQKLPLLELKDSNGPRILAFNEFAIERASARAAHISLTIDNHKFEKFIGDGLIISTPQGSTAYASAAGGAIIPYDVKAFQVTPSNPHQSALYKALRQPLVLGSNTSLGIDVIDHLNRPVRAVSDGHDVTASQSFEVSLSRRSVPMLRTASFDFYARLSQKLIG